MSHDQDGLAIARERIAEEARARTGFLDLGTLGLDELPAELFALPHLRSLNLGPLCFDGPRRYVKAKSDFAPNRLDSQLSRLAALPNLHALSVAGTELSTLADIASLTALQSLDCTMTLVADLSPLRELRELQSLACSVTLVADLSPVRELRELQSLACSVTQVADLSPLGELRALQSLYCFRTQVADLSPLRELRALQSLDCSETPVADLSPLGELRALQSLDCWSTKVADLSPLRGLSALQSLACSGTLVADLSPLRGLSALQSLACSGTQVADLSPLRGLSALQSLACSGTQVADLSPLQGLSALQSLDCSATQVADLSPLGGLSALQSLACSWTQVADLSPLQGLSALQSLDCSWTQVADLSPLRELSALQSLDCSQCVLRIIPVNFWHKTSLRRLYLRETHVPGIPREVLSQYFMNDCLESLRAHLGDLRAGAIVMPDVKLIVLGNGRVGKTQICRRLRDEDYDARVPSTHGVIVTSGRLPAADSAEPAVLHIWDFGGQDIYHGTHALFMRTRAAFMIVWTPEAESSAEHVWEGMSFRNHPLPYWIDTVRHLGAPGSPVLIVQARCDRLEDDVHRLPAPPGLLTALPHWELQYSALNNRKRAALDEALSEAVGRVRGLEGEITIGTGRLKIKQTLEQLRDSERTVPPERRQYRTITQQHFRQLCDEAGGISAPEHLLSYLHNAGIVFYRSGLFDDQIILDQAWALEAIYAVFNRESCYRPLRHLRGRFTREILSALAWRKYSAAEQEVFLGMMRSCGICFVHRQGTRDSKQDEEYIAPDLLPDRGEIQTELDAVWDEEGPVETSEFEYALLHPGMVRSVISRIGSEAGVTALYWQGGVCVYEARTRSRALIEQKMADEWGGKIVIRTQRGQAAELLRRLSALVREESARMGAEPVNAPPTERSQTIPETSSASDERAGSEPMPPLQFSSEHGAEPQYFVSYGWGDENKEGRRREAIVDRLCEAAEQRGLVIHRDKRVLRLGDSISKFMQRLAGGDRVFVILSDKYLRSPYCMYELLEIWRKCSGEGEKFLDRIRVFVIPGTKIFSLMERAQYAIHWQQEYDKIDQLIQQHRGHIVGRRGFQEYKLMSDFHRWVAEILETITDRLQPRKFEDLVKYGLDDLPPVESGPPARDR